MPSIAANVFAPFDAAASGSGAGAGLAAIGDASAAGTFGAMVASAAPAPAVTTTAMPGIDPKFGSVAIATLLASTAELAAVPTDGVVLTPPPVDTPVATPDSLLKADPAPLPTVEVEVTVADAGPVAAPAPAVAPADPAAPPKILAKPAETPAAAPVIAPPDETPPQPTAVSEPEKPASTAGATPTPPPSALPEPALPEANAKPTPPVPVAPAVAHGAAPAKVPANAAAVIATVTPRAPRVAVTEAAEPVEASAEELSDEEVTDLPVIAAAPADLTAIAAPVPPPQAITAPAQPVTDPAPAQQSDNATPADTRVGTIAAPTAPETAPARADHDTPATAHRDDGGSTIAPALADAGPTASRDGAPAFSLPANLTPTTTVTAVPAARAAADVITAQPGRIGQELGVAIARHVAGNGATGGGDTITLRLDPVDMGRIEVKLSFDDGGTLRAVVSADNPAALDMLRRDSVDLGRALTDAGVRSDAQTLRFDTRAGTGQGGSGGQSGQRQPDPRAGATTEARTDTPNDITAAYRPLRTRGRVDLVA